GASSSRGMPSRARGELHSPQDPLMAATSSPPPRRKPWRALLLGAVLCGIGTSVAFWASAHDAEPTAEPPPQDAPKSDIPLMKDGVLQFSRTYAERAGIVVEPVNERSLAPVTDVTGHVDFSPNHVAAVGTRIFGHVDEVDVLPGQSVEAGEALARLVSSELGEAQARLHTAGAREQFAEVD